MAVTVAVAFAAWTAAMPQSAEYDKFKDEVLADYNNYRDSVYQRYEDFKSRVLDHYADFLNGEWHEFEPEIMQEQRLPKPVKMPKVESGMVYRSDEIPLPEAAINTVSLPSLNKVPDARLRSRKVDLERGPVLSNYEMAANKIADPGFAFGPYPGQMIAAQPGETWIEVSVGTIDTNSKAGIFKKKKSTPGGNGKPEIAKTLFDDFEFDFYGMTVHIPDCDFKINEKMDNLWTQSGENFKNLYSQQNALEATRQLFGLAQQLGLNGYLTYRLAEHYVNAKFPDATEKAKLSTVHYLLSQMGYDVRLGALGAKKEAFIMMPFDQNSIAGFIRTRTTGSNRAYYLIEPLEKDYDEFFTGKGFYTCPIPVKDCGKTSDLRLTGLNLPMKAKPFEISDGDLAIKGDVNENFMKMIYRYPKMPMGDFASSWLDDDLRQDIQRQIKSQLEGVPEQEAINKLMKLFHYGFVYQTDHENHGFEKPYFIEENLYYDKNDCEDRAMFFSYLVWNVLGLPCELIQYSNHESTAVAANCQLSGAYYPNADGLKYYSADPTWEGSHWGMIASPYDKESPKIDKIYK